MPAPARAPLWSPPDPAATAITRFRLAANSKFALSLTSYNDLHNWSTTHPSQFWSLVWEFTNITASVQATAVVDETIPINHIPKWFTAARLNYAQNLLRFRDSHPAIVFATESPTTITTITYQQLYSRVEVCADALRMAGVGVGDRVVGYLPNCIDAVVAMLAATSVGAVWSCASPDFGVVGVLERFSQIKPKILFSVNAVLYNGKVWDHMDKLRNVAAGLPTLSKVIVIPFIDQPVDISMIPNAVLCADFLETGDGRPLVFEQLPFDHPSFILYSSGTTGKPKCIVHSGGGCLIQHNKEHIIHGDLTRDDVFFYYTTTGWMMWNWLVSALAVGCTIVLYDGSPFKDTPTRLWDLADQLNITIFGTSAKYIQSLQEGKLSPRTTHNLSSLRTIYSTGSPLKPDSFDYVYTHIKQSVLLASITGGTDIVSLFAGHNTSLPVYRGEIQCITLGMAVHAYSPAGTPVYDLSGDLVCTKPFPCMPVSFYDDPDGEKYRNAYFAQMEGVWWHGDFVQVNKTTGGVVVLGRSDGTLNPAGVRFGSAELYNIVAEFPEVADSVAVGQKINEEEERVILFLKMSEGKEFSNDLVTRLCASIRTLLTPRHVPAVILPIADIPYTLTGKKVEVAVKRAVAGEKVEGGAALRNPEALELYVGIPELQVSVG